MRRTSPPRNPWKPPADAPTVEERIARAKLEHPPLPEGIRRNPYDEPEDGGEG